MGHSTVCRLLLACLCTCAAAEDFPPPEDNLLANPGFEMLTPDGTPEDWDLFVMPMEGVLGRVSSNALSGDRSVSLFTPAPYPVDPANNWSQVVYGDFGGKTLKASVMVRTEEVGGAALWIQCFQRAPVRVLATGSSGIDYALTGTNDWTEVIATVDVPQLTGYVVVRCVIQGVGRVWFDDASLAVGPAQRAVEAEVEPEPQPSIAEQVALVREQMQIALDELQTSNQGLRSEIGELQSELMSLRDELRERERDAAAMRPSPASTEELERARRDIQGSLEDQAAASEALRAEIDDIESRLEQLQPPATPPVVIVPPAERTAPELAGEFDRLRQELEVVLAERDAPDAELREAVADVREELRKLNARLGDPAMTEEGETPSVTVEIPPAVLEDLNTARDQLRDVLSTRDQSDDELRIAISEMSGQLNDIRARLDTLEAAPPSPEPVAAPAEAPEMLEQFDALRGQIQSTLNEVRQANEELQERIGGLQTDLQELRGHLAEVEAAEEALDAPPREEPLVRHILVPREPGVQR